MPQNIPAISLSATKMASGNVMLIFSQDNAMRYALAIPAADFTALNTTVNGGAAGANITKAYAQDASITDYPLGYVSGA